MNLLKSEWDPLPDCHFYEQTRLNDSVKNSIARALGREITWKSIGLGDPLISETGITILLISRAERAGEQAELFFRQNEKSEGRFVGIVYDDSPKINPFNNAIAEAKFSGDRESLRYVEFCQKTYVNGPELIGKIREVANRSGMSSNRGLLARMRDVALPLLGVATFVASVYATYVFSASLLVPALQVVALSICVVAVWKLATNRQRV